MKFSVVFLTAACAMLGACSPLAPPNSPSNASGSDDNALVAPSAAPSSSPASDPASGRMTAPPVVTAAGDQLASDNEQATNASIDALLGDHVAYEIAIKTLQRAVAACDAADVAAMVDYPIKLHVDKKSTSIIDAKMFVSSYAGLMTPEIANAITTAQYSDLMVNAKGIMFGDGQAWINGICKDVQCAHVDVKVITLQSVAR